MPEDDSLLIDNMFKKLMLSIAVKISNEIFSGKLALIPIDILIEQLNVMSRTAHAAYDIW